MTHADKILGVHVDDNLMWNNHFQHVSKKISTYLWLLSKIRFYLSVELILSRILCTAVLCGAIRQAVTLTTESHNNRITKLQRRASLSLSSLSLSPLSLSLSLSLSLTLCVYVCLIVLLNLL